MDSCFHLVIYRRSLILARSWSSNSLSKWKSITPNYAKYFALKSTRNLITRLTVRAEINSLKMKSPKNTWLKNNQLKKSKCILISSKPPFWKLLRLTKTILKILMNMMMAPSKETTWLKSVNTRSSYLKPKIEKRESKTLFSIANVFPIVRRRGILI